LQVPGSKSKKKAATKTGATKMGAAANLGSGHDPFVTDIHAVGKLLHSKSMFTSSYSGFLFLFIFSGKPSEPGQDSKTRSPLAFDPEQIVLAAKMGVPAFTDFVQANCLHRFTDVDDLSTCLGLFSDAAMFFDPKFGFKVLSHLVVMLCDVFDSVHRWQ